MRSSHTASETAASDSTPQEPRPTERILAIDAYRGFVMLLMMAEVLEFAQLADAFPQSAFWRFLAFHQSHVPWVGCSLHDLIQPSFSFLVGVALPYSLLARRQRGEPFSRTLAHAVRRSLILVLLGVFLRSMHARQTNWTFEDTLSQIGLGYLPLFFLGFATQRNRWIAFALILICYWAAFAFFPLPGADFSAASVGVPPDWPHNATGLAAHWNKNTNLAWAFDTWFLNLFPRESPFTHNGGGYATLSFIPTLATMLLGLIAGSWLQSVRPPARLLSLLILAGIATLALGFALGQFGLCPVVKRIWTPSWVLFSGGWCLILLALFFASTDLAGWAAWSFPLRVIGANPITAYVLAHIANDFIASSCRIHFGRDVFSVLGEAYEPLVAGVTVLLVEWLVLFWMHRRKIFIRI
jgi:predicted acyltransferase